VLDINKLNVALRVFGKEALWTDGSYFSWGFGSTYNYFADEIRIGGPGAQLQKLLFMWTVQSK